MSFHERPSLFEREIEARPEFLFHPDFFFWKKVLQDRELSRKTMNLVRELEREVKSLDVAPPEPLKKGTGLGFRVYGLGHSEKYSL